MKEEHFLHLRLAELTRLRDDYAGRNKPNIVNFLDRLISDARSELDSAESAVESE